MAWLLRDGDVLAAVEELRPGWHHSPPSAVLVRSPALVHTLTPSHARALDLAWCGWVEGHGERRVLRVRRIGVIGRYRVAIPHLGGGGLVAAPAGTFERWRLKVGDRLEVCQA